MSGYHRHLPDAPSRNPFDQYDDGYGEIDEIDEGDSIFDLECVRCRKACNSDESPDGICPDCWKN